MTALQLVSPYELNVVNVLRVRSWMWLPDTTVWRQAQEHGRTPRRKARYHLRRLVEMGLAESRVDIEPYRGVFYRWNRHAPTAAAAGLEAACIASRQLLEPVAEAPTHCPAGHRYAEDGHVFSDGEYRCFACGEVVRDHGHVYVAGKIT